MSTVSIIIPTYNRINLLKECIESLLAQTYSDIELIVVDDGSTDDTQATVTEIAKKHNNVRYYPRPHFGACAARNFGLEQSSGEFIGFFDSDDLWPANYIETMLKSLQANPDFDAAYSNIMNLIEGKVQGQYITMEKPPTGYITAELFFRNKPFNLPSSTIFRKKVWAGILWDETLIKCQDCDVFLRISTRAKFMHVPEVYMMHRKTQDSISTKAARDLFTLHMHVMKRFYFQLGGSSYVPKKKAFRRISHLYRSYALKHYRAGNINMSIALLKRALYYRPLDLRLYVNLFRAFLLNSGDDKIPDRQMSLVMPAFPAKKD